MGLLAVGLSQYYASAIFEISGEGLRICGGLTNFQDPGGWPMSDNVIFQGGSDPRCQSGVPITRLLFTNNNVQPRLSRYFADYKVVPKFKKFFK